MTDFIPTVDEFIDKFNGDMFFCLQFDTNTIFEKNTLVFNKTKYSRIYYRVIKETIIGVDILDTQYFMLLDPIKDAIVFQNMVALDKLQSTINERCDDKIIPNITDSKKKLAIMLYVAHILIKSQINLIQSYKTPGTLTPRYNTSEKTQDLQVTMQTIQQGQYTSIEADFRMTKYGQELLALIIQSRTQRQSFFQF